MVSASEGVVLRQIPVAARLHMQRQGRRKAFHYSWADAARQVKPQFICTSQVEMTAVEQVVLDTNVVLDCFMFCDPAARTIVSAIQSGRWQWLATPDMRQELGSVVDRPELGRWQARRSATMAALTQYGRMVAPPASPAPPELTCSDDDDQKFIDLAWSRRVNFLFTRDKALLRLAGRIQSSGVRVLRPINWRVPDDGLPKPSAP